MTFSMEVKHELARVSAERPCCTASELNALTQFCGAVRFENVGQASVVYTASSATVAKRILLLLKRRASVSPELRVIRHARFGGQREYRLSVSGREGWELLSSLHILRDMGEDIRLRTLSHRALTRKCCRRAYLRGAFLAVGSVTSPEKGRHLQFLTATPVLANALARVLAAGDVTAKQLAKDGGTMVYLKDGDQIVTLLSLMGASQSLMRMENIRAQRSLRNAVTRMTNCDAGNLEKQLAASREQVRMITALSLGVGLSSLPGELAALARLRLSNPDASLAELGAMLDPPLGKSGVSHRLRKIRDIAEQIGVKDHDDQTD